MAEPKTQIDTLICARWIIPVEPARQVLDNHALAIQSNRIIEILPQQAAELKYQPENRFNLETHALLPGFINAHGHAAMTLFRGMADDLPLMVWLNNHIWPAEGRWVSEEFVATGTELAIAEMLLSGTTCFSDMYFFPDVTARICQRLGMRAQVSAPILDFPTVWAKDASEYIHKGLAVHDEFRHSDLIQVCLGPHSPYAVSDASLKQTSMLANELDTNIQIHLHETKQEVEDALKETGERPIQRLQRLGLLSPRLQCVHMTQVNDGDIELLKEHGCHVIHCPESNLKLASGFCPTAKLIANGINVALGTDSAASNNDLDMAGEMKIAALLAKGVAEDASVIPAHQALRMATLNGAIALGIESLVGSLEPGKLADIIAVDFDSPGFQPVFDPISHIAYLSSGQRVSHSWVNGNLMVTDGQLLCLNQAELLSRQARWAKKISAAETQQQMIF